VRDVSVEQVPVPVKVEAKVSRRVDEGENLPEVARANGKHKTGRSDHDWIDM
jgi:hypothetical protein